MVTNFTCSCRGTSGAPRSAPCLLVAACHPAVKSTLPNPPTRNQIAQLWVEPAPGRDLYWGVGGKALAPDPAATYTVLEIKRTGFSPGYTVTGPDKRQWSAKLPPEAPTEVVASRIHWGVGYHQPPIYYLAKWQAEKATSPNPQLPARFREKNPALQRRPRGQPGPGPTTRIPSSARASSKACSCCRRCSATRISRMTTTPLYALGKPFEGARTWYVARDLGHTFGRTGVLDAPRGDIEVFEKTPFITGVVNGRVTFDWRGRHDALLDDITPADVRWICGRLQRLREAQWRDAFSAGGYPPADADPVHSPAEAEDRRRPGAPEDKRACRPDLPQLRDAETPHAGNQRSARAPAAGGGRSGTRCSPSGRDARARRTRMPAVVQTQIILSVVGAIIMLVVGASLARAFGIVGAANLIRYRSKIDDPKDAVVMLCALAVGLASGVGLYALAVFSTVFLVIALGIIESFEKGLKKFRSDDQDRRSDRRAAAEASRPSCAASSWSTSSRLGRRGAVATKSPCPSTSSATRVPTPFSGSIPKGTPPSTGRKRRTRRSNRETDYPARRGPHAAAAGGQAREDDRSTSSSSASIGRRWRRRSPRRWHAASRFARSSPTPIAAARRTCASSSCGCSAAASSSRAPPTT